MADSEKPGVWQAFKDSFKPTAARADQNIARNKEATGDQYAKDKAQGQAYMRERFVKGYVGQK